MSIRPLNFRPIYVYLIKTILGIIGLSIFCSCNNPKPSHDVTFIERTPVIDGKLDAFLESLPSKEFTYIWQFDNPVTDTVPVRYRMGYTATHLYLYIETAEDRISYHRRGYLWGDGYKILLGMPKKDSLTDEYYELSYSPSKEKNHWDRQRIMAYNFNQVTKPLSTQSISQEVSTGKKSGFEALIAWSDIEPYHPWFLGEIGCNIYFAKGINSQEHGYITNGYSLVDDEGIWSEEIPKRKYRKITFQLPETVSQPTTIAALRKKNLEEGKPLIVEIASIAKKAVEETIRISCFNKQKEEVLTKEYKIKSSDNLTKENLQVRLEGMSPGIYTVLIQTTEKKLGEHVISIRPEIDGENISTEIQKNKPKLPMGSLHTLQFELNEILNKYRALKPYESGESVHHLWKEFEKNSMFLSKELIPIKGYRDRTEELLNQNMIKVINRIQLSYPKTMTRLRNIRY